MVQGGTLHVGDVMLSGGYTGKVKAMFNERGQKIDAAGPSTPVSVLGLNGAPTAGDNFNVLDDEKEAKDNYFIKTRTYENDKKRAGWFYFKYKDLIESSIQPNESGTSMNNTTKATYTVNSKGVYVFYNSNTKKAVVIVVE